jgi:hypothetical protein
LGASDPKPLDYTLVGCNMRREEKNSGTRRLPVGPPDLLVGPLGHPEKVRTAEVAGDWTARHGWWCCRRVGLRYSPRETVELSPSKRFLSGPLLEGVGPCTNIV